MQILRNLHIVVVTAALVVPAACSRTDTPDKVLIDLKTGQRIEGDTELELPETPLTPEDIASQQRHMEESIAVMKQFQRALAEVTDLQSLEEARPRLEELAARMGASLRIGNSIEKLAPEVELKYAAEVAAASKSLDELCRELQKDAELWSAIQDILQAPIEEAAGDGT